MTLKKIRANYIIVQSYKKGSAFLFIVIILVASIYLQGSRLRTECPIETFKNKLFLSH